MVALTELRPGGVWYEQRGESLSMEEGVMLLNAAGLAKGRK